MSTSVFLSESWYPEYVWHGVEYSSELRGLMSSVTEQWTCLSPGWSSAKFTEMLYSILQWRYKMHDDLIWQEATHMNT